MPDTQGRDERKAERAADRAQHAEEREQDLATAEIIQAGAAVQAAKLTAVAEQLVATARESIYQSTKSRMLRALVVFFILASLVGNLIAAVTAFQVKDCTTPSGGCYQRGAAQTGQAVGSINAVTQIAVICADQFDGRSAIEACIHDRLRAIGLEK